jgi:hypothetical protein
LLGTPKDTLRFWNWASASIVALLLGNMEGRFTLGPLREKKNFFAGFERHVTMPCNQVSLSIGGPVGETVWSSFARTFERKEKVYLVSFLGHRGH